MKKEDIENNPVLKLSLEFSVEIIAYCELLTEKKKFVIANQLLRSATSIGAHAFEAQNAESLADFVHKFKGAAKEAGETEYWLWLCNHSEGYPPPGLLFNKIDSLNRLIGKIISGSTRK